MATPDFEQVYDGYASRLFGYFAHRVSSRVDAEELTQLTFERAVTGWESFDPARGSIRIWLFAIANNLLIDRHRRGSPFHGGEVPLDNIYCSEEPQVPGPEENLGLSPEIAAALALLSDREREILALRFASDLGGAEIAAVTNLSLANVQQITSRSLGKLRSHLRSGMYGHPDVGESLSAGCDAQKASGPSPASPIAASDSSSSPEVA